MDPDSGGPKHAGPSDPDLQYYLHIGNLKMILFIKLFFLGKSFIAWVVLEWKRKGSTSRGLAK
jgi:hypothetical protein